MSPRLLATLTGMSRMFDIPPSAITNLDHCNPRARRWRQAGCHGRWDMDLRTLLARALED